MADALYSFDTNIEEVLARIRRGLADIASATKRDISSSGGGQSQLSNVDKFVSDANKAAERLAQSQKSIVQAFRNNTLGSNSAGGANTLAGELQKAFSQYERTVGRAAASRKIEYPVALKFREDAIPQFLKNARDAIDAANAEGLRNVGGVTRQRGRSSTTGGAGDYETTKTNRFVARAEKSTFDDAFADSSRRDLKRSRRSSAAAAARSATAASQAATADEQIARDAQQTSRELRNARRAQLAAPRTPLSDIYANATTKLDPVVSRDEIVRAGKRGASGGGEDEGPSFEKTVTQAGVNITRGLDPDNEAHKVAERIKAIVDAADIVQKRFVALGRNVDDITTDEITAQFLRGRYGSGSGKAGLPRQSGYQEGVFPSGAGTAGGTAKNLIDTRFGSNDVYTSTSRGNLPLDTRSEGEIRANERRAGELAGDVTKANQAVAKLFESIDKFIATEQRQITTSNLTAGATNNAKFGPGVYELPGNRAVDTRGDESVYYQRARDGLLDEITERSKVVDAERAYGKQLNDATNSERIRQTADTRTQNAGFLRQGANPDEKFAPGVRDLGGGYAVDERRLNSSVDEFYKSAGAGFDRLGSESTERAVALGRQRKADDDAYAAEVAKQNAIRLQDASRSNGLVREATRYSGTGIRVLEDDVEQFYKKLGDGLRQVEVGSTEYVQEQAAFNRSGKGRGFFGGIAHGLTSGGIGGNGTDGLSGIGTAIGTTAKYSALYDVLGALESLLGRLGTEMVNFADSNTNLGLAIDSVTGATGEADRVSQDYINTLERTSIAAGANVGDIQDVVASGIRTIGINSAYSKKELEGLGNEFGRQAQTMAVLGKTNLLDAAGNLRAIGSAFNIPLQNSSRVNDALVSGKNIGGGDEKQTAQAVASAGASLSQAGFSLEQSFTLASRIQAATDETGAAVGNKLSRIIAIVQGSAGRNAISDFNASLTPDQIKAGGGKVNIDADPQNQIQQLSRLYSSGTLTQQQIGPLVNSLFGTSSSKEGITALEDYADLADKLGDGFSNSGVAAKELQQRMDDLSQTVRDFQGSISALLVNIGQSHFLDPVLATFKLLTESLRGLSAAVGFFDSLNGALTRTVAYGAELAVFVTILQKIRKASAETGEGFYSALERRYRPKTYLARQEIRDRTSGKSVDLEDEAARRGARTPPAPRNSAPQAAPTVATTRSTDGRVPGLAPTRVSASAAVAREAELAAATAAAATAAAAEKAAAATTAAVAATATAVTAAPDPAPARIGSGGLADAIIAAEKSSSKAVATRALTAAEYTLRDIEAANLAAAETSGRPLPSIAGIREAQTVAGARASAAVAAAAIEAATYAEAQLAAEAAAPIRTARPGGLAEAIQRAKRDAAAAVSKGAAGAAATSSAAVAAEAVAGAAEPTRARPGGLAEAIATARRQASGAVTTVATVSAEQAAAAIAAESAGVLAGPGLFQATTTTSLAAIAEARAVAATEAAGGVAKSATVAAESVLAEIAALPVDVATFKADQGARLAILAAEGEAASIAAAKVEAAAKAAAAAAAGQVAATPGAGAAAGRKGRLGALFGRGKSAGVVAEGEGALASAAGKGALARGAAGLGRAASLLLGPEALIAAIVGTAAVGKIKSSHDKLSDAMDGASKSLDDYKKTVDQVNTDGTLDPEKKIENLRASASQSGTAAERVQDAGTGVGRLFSRGSNRQKILDLREAETRANDSADALTNSTIAQGKAMEGLRSFGDPATRTLDDITNSLAGLNKEGKNTPQAVATYIKELGLNPDGTIPGSKKKNASAGASDAASSDDGGTTAAASSAARAAAASKAANAAVAGLGALGKDYTGKVTIAHSVGPDNPRYASGRLPNNYDQTGLYGPPASLFGGAPRIIDERVANPFSTYFSKNADKLNQTATDAIGKVGKSGLLSDKQINAAGEAIEKQVAADATAVYKTLSPKDQKNPDNNPAAIAKRARDRFIAGLQGQNAINGAATGQTADPLLGSQELGVSQTNVEGQLKLYDAQKSILANNPDALIKAGQRTINVIKSEIARTKPGENTAYLYELLTSTEQEVAEQQVSQGELILKAQQKNAKTSAQIRALGDAFFTKYAQVLARAGDVTGLISLMDMANTDEINTVKAILDAKVKKDKKAADDEKKLNAAIAEADKAFGKTEGDGSRLNPNSGKEGSGLGVLAPGADPSLAGKKPSTKAQDQYKKDQDAQKAFKDAVGASTPDKNGGGDLATGTSSSTDDPVATAIAIRNQNALGAAKLDAANRAVADATDEVNKSGQTALEAAQSQKALNDALYEQSQAQLDYAKTAAQLKIDFTDPVAVARQALRDSKNARAQAIKDANKHDLKGDARKDFLNTFELNERQSRVALENTTQTTYLSDLQTSLSVGRISHGRYLELLKARRDQLTVEYKAMQKDDAGRKQKQAAIDAITQAIKSEADSLSGQFNLGDIKIPTVYQVRRSLKQSSAGTILGSNPALSAAGNVTNDNSTRNIIMNGVSLEQVLAVLKDQFGVKTRTTASRRIKSA